MEYNSKNTEKYLNIRKLFHYMNLDKKDIEIINILEKDASLTTQNISRITRIPITTIHNRIKKLKKEGVIKNFTINLDYDKYGKPISAYILITITYHIEHTKKTDQLQIAKKLKAFDEVTSSSIVTGTTDIITKVRVSSIDELNTFIIHKLRNVEGIDKTQTMIVLKEV